MWDTHCRLSSVLARLTGIDDRRVDVTKEAITLYAFEFDVFLVDDLKPIEAGLPGQGRS